MGKGLTDQGKSFDKGLELLDKDFYIRSWLSEKTFNMFSKVKRQIMVNYNYAGGFATITSYLLERVNNIMANFEIGTFVSNLLGTVILGLLTGPGKFSIMSPLFTGWYPTIMGTVSVIFSIAFQCAINRFYAHGNLILIGLEIFNWE